MSLFYVTTPIYYVNDRPHIGHAYTTVAADVISRWHRLLGRQSYFLTGIDEHGQKVFRAAQKRGISPQEHVDELALSWQAVWKKLQIENNDFIRTTSTSHQNVVKAVLQHLFDQGDIYSDNYEGWYSTSEERFWTDKDLVDGKCPLSGNPVEWIQEKNYFFRMSKYADTLRQWIDDHPDFLRPQSRRNEVLGYLRKDVGDLCISRPKTRLPWGISLPFDDDYVTYVWFDALLNYISNLGYHPDPKQRSAAFETHWPASYHIMGKDILTTHSVYWSTMLFALGLEPADSLFAHGWWTIEGKKMSKSLGNVVDPHLLIDNYGVDAVRFFLLREISFGLDGNFSHDAFLLRYNTDLANDFGNLAHRAFSMTCKWLGGTIPALDESTEADLEVENLAQKVFQDFSEQIEKLHFSQALESLWSLIRQGNKYIDTQQPWKLNREGNTKRLGGVMRRSLEICRLASWLLSPFMPNKSQEMLAKLHSAEATALNRLDGLQTGQPIEIGSPLFPRMRELPEAIQKIRAQALGEPAPSKPKPTVQRIKMKVFTRVPFRSAIIRQATQTNQQLQLHVDVGEEKLLVITGALQMEDSNKLIGKEITVVGPSTRENFQKIILKTGQITSAKQHPEADKLLVLSVDIGEDSPRSIVAGIADKFAAADLLNHPVTIVANLKPSKLRGVVSEGMILAAGGQEIQSLAISPQKQTGNQISWFGEGEFGALLADQSTFLTFSAQTKAGSIVR